MRNKISLLCFYAGITLISIPLQAQSLNLGNPGSAMSSAVEQWFPWIAGVIFLFVAFKNMGNLVGEGGDVWKGIKNLLLYVLVVLVVVGVYRWIKSQSL
ncbi:hypothetical protein J2O02_18295 (plasmid) [Elizabethkingia anophelis]|uniref:hypothetical protein n=1 Tax=Elizabethkingia anophelis TaxID=1117645 RepID=UPI0020B69E2C|nr:hypothetical protein [Elizabethkingia anophelis]UTG66817.1 hypothetical protein J2O02_18295 [Elizabethkingia anophelis]